MKTLSLLAQRRFGPLFWTQLAGAFNDNLFKNALVASFAFGGVAGTSRSAAEIATLVNLSAGLFILPFFLFSAVAGRIADAVDKARLVRAVKLAEVGIMSLAAVGFVTGSTPLLFAVLFLMGAQSAFFGPLKYAILPQHLAASELVAGNGLVSTATFVAIVAGTLFGVFLPPHVVALAVVAVAVLGYAHSRAIPDAPSAGGVRIDCNPARETLRTIAAVARERWIFLAILAVSWFWLLGSLYLAQLPSVCTEVLGGGAETMGFLLVAFAVGVGAGSLSYAKLARGRVEPGWIFVGAVGLSVFGIDFSLALHPASLAAPSVPRLAADLALLGLSGGLYAVPLYAFIQHASAPERRSRTIAANNVLNALFMVVGAGGAIALRGVGFGVGAVLLTAAVANVAIVAAVLVTLRRPVLRFVVSALVHVFYRVTKRGLDHVPADAPALLVSNHASLVDAPLIAAACDRPVRFVMDHRIYETPALRWFFDAVGAIPIAPREEDPDCTARAFEAIRAALEDGELVCIFPEGRLTKDGELDSFRRGVEAILARTPVPVVPMALRGLWGSFFSRAHGAPMAGRPRGFGSPVEVVCGAPVAPAEASAELLRARVAALRGPRC